jgi:putative tryptophan/tyrosine transport system substrate-binding protein
MHRRAFVTGLGAVLAAPLAAEAQQPKTVPRIGFVSVNVPAVMSARTEAFRQGLSELGYLEGKTSSSSGDTQMENLIASARSRPSSCVSKWTSSSRLVRQ